MCDLNNLECPQCGTTLKVKGLHAEVITAVVGKIQSGEKQKRKATKGDRKATDDDRKIIVRALQSGTYECHRLAKETGLRVPQVRALKAWCSDNLGGKEYIKRHI